MVGSPAKSGESPSAIKGVSVWVALHLSLSRRIKMSEFYKKATNLYIPNAAKPYKLSRSKMELFTGCKRCFYLDRRLGIARPPGFPFNLNSCVDSLLKNEFDSFREKGERHPIQPKGFVPFKHEMLDVWRANFKGVQYCHEATNFLLTGAVDDLWEDKDGSGKIAVVDYKSTSKKDRITVLDQDWHNGYKRQMEFYQWLLRRSGMEVSDTGYFVYCNGDSSLPMFNKRIEFDMTLIPHKGDDSWVEDCLFEMKKCLDGDSIPEADAKCDYCNYLSMCSNLEK